MTFAVFALVILTLFIVFNPDYSSKELEREPFKLVDFLAPSGSTRSSTPTSSGRSPAACCSTPATSP